MMPDPELGRDPAVTPPRPSHAPDDAQTFERIAACARDAIITIDQEGKITYWNPAAESIFGYTPEEVLGQELHQLLAPSRFQEAYRPALARFAETGEGPVIGKTLELVALRKGGTEFPIELSISSSPHLGRWHAIGIIRDITERKQSEEILKRAMHQNELLLRSIGEGICELDRAGRLIFANPTAARMLGYRLEELLGQDLHVLIHHEPNDEACIKAECLGRFFSREHETDVYQETFCRADGSTFPAECICNPIQEEGRLVGLALTFRDITERLSIEQLKNSFISVVSHELRTPLTSLFGALRLLDGGKLGILPEKPAQMIDIAVRSTERLIRLINDILDLERINTGQIVLRKQPCEAEDLIHQACDAMRGLADHAESKLEIGPTQGQVLADPDRMLQTLSNLISNAIKFSPPHATVTLSTESRGTHLLFSVKDYGRGIPADKIEAIFERFQQVDASDSREKGGTGLGLAICRSIVEQHGGRIWAESTEGQGSTFFFTLPRP